MLQYIFNANTAWLFLTAVIFTWVGFIFAYQRAQNITDITLDMLIERGYLKTVIVSGKQKIVKYDHESNNVLDS